MHLIERAKQDLETLEKELSALEKINTEGWNSAEKRSHNEAKTGLKICVLKLTAVLKQVQNTVDLNDQSLIFIYAEMTALPKAPGKDDLVRELGEKSHNARVTVNVRNTTTTSPNFHHECLYKTMSDINSNNLITSSTEKTIDRRNQFLRNLFTLIAGKESYSNGKWISLPVELKKVILYHVAVAESVAIGKKPQQIIALVDFLFSQTGLAENFKTAHQSKHTLTIKENIISEGKIETYKFDFFPMPRVKISTQVKKEFSADDNANKVSQFKQ